MSGAAGVGERPRGPRPAGAAPPSAPARLGLVPREHGASFMSVHALVLGIVAGLTAGPRGWTGVAIAVAVEAAFLPFTAAVSVMTHPRLAQAARRRAIGLGAALALLGALALLQGPRRELLALGAVGAAVGALYALARARAGARSVAAQLAAIAGISLLASFAWLVVAGPTPRWPLGAVWCFLAFGGAVPYVRERVRRRRLGIQRLDERLRGGALALAWQVAALGIAWGLAWAGRVTPLAAVAFVPGALKTLLGIAFPERRPELRRIGYLETAISTLFAVLAGMGLGFPGFV
ncbi:MAG: hypothetical protein KatS3mg014_2164 [Actinomycetota bacterium]|nr:MAG: hypothetical protein KatS3mg014_2164 [Actinomycetota bacterium]